MPTRKLKLKLSHIALASTFFINIVALLRATNNDIHFDLGQNLLYRLVTGETVYYIRRLGGHWALMYREPINTLDLNQSTFLTSKRFQPSRMAYKPVGVIATKWHKILGYTGPDAIEQLPKHVNGAELAEERAPLKIECEVCSLAKHTQ